MAIRAHRRLPVCLCDRLAVNALLKFFGDLIVAFAARQRHVEFEDRRFCFFGVENFMRAMAVGADGRFFGSVGDRVSVNTLLVRSDRLHSQSTLFHYEFLAVTRAACRRDVDVIDAGFGVARRQQFMRAAVAIDTRCRIRVSTFYRPGVQAAVVGGLLVRMAGRAGDMLRRGFVRSALYIRVTVHASEHAAMDRVFEGLRINMQAYRLPVYLVRQRGITVAGHAFVDRRFCRVFFGCGVQRTRG